jgi:hypothetical protein
MKVNYFITTILFSIFLMGCEVTATNYPIHNRVLTEYEVELVVKDALATRDDPYTYYWNDQRDEYYFEYDDIEVENDYIGDVTLVTVDTFYGYNNHNPYKGSLKLINDDATIYIDVVDDYYLDITFYDYYHSSFEMRFRTTWEELGFNLF